MNDKASEPDWLKEAREEMGDEAIDAAIKMGEEIAQRIGPPPSETFLLRTVGGGPADGTRVVEAELIGGWPPADILPGLAQWRGRYALESYSRMPPVDNPHVKRGAQYRWAADA
jgi:hypothetical protein